MLYTSTFAVPSGIISRGYGRKSKGLQIVHDGKNLLIDVHDAGDEPFLIAKILNDIPVIVSENKSFGITQLINNYNVDMIIMDDAFQHRSIERDLDLVLLNSQSGPSDYRLIPHGLLREPFNHIKRADAIIFTKTNLSEPDSKIVLKAKKTNLPIFNSSIMNNQFFNIDFEDIKPESKTRAIAVSGIADPNSFYKSLDKTNIELVSKISYVDHHEFKQSDVDQFKQELINNSAEIIVTTEKDMIRLTNLNLSEINIYSLSIDFQLDEPGEQYIINLFK